MTLPDLTVTWESGFIQDDEELTNIVNARNGGIPTLSLEDSIAILDDITPSEARKKAASIISPVNETNAIESNQERDSTISASNVEDIVLTPTDEIEKEEKEQRVSPFGGGDIGETEKL